MSQYQKLNDLILERLGKEFLFLGALFTRDIREEADRLSICTGVESYRVFDRRLQVLRKAGRIAYFKGNGWGLA